MLIGEPPSGWLAPVGAATHERAGLLLFLLFQDFPFYSFTFLWYNGINKSNGKDKWKGGQTNGAQKNYLSRSSRSFMDFAGSFLLF